jgi:hypothetical protein
MPPIELVQQVANEFTGRSDAVPKVTVQPAETSKEPAAKSAPKTSGVVK